MVLIPCILLAAFPPGFLFPQMAARMSANRRDGRRREAGETRDQTQSSSRLGIPEDNGRDLEERNLEKRDGFAEM